MAKLIAIAVVIKYKPIAFPPMRPNFVVSCSEQTPQTRETKTKGTTSIRKLAINTCPIISRIPLTRKFCRDNSKKKKLKTKSLPFGISHCKNEPRAMPAIIPMTIRAVKLRFF